MKYSKNDYSLYSEQNFKGITDESVQSSIEAISSEVLHNFENDYGMPLEVCVSTIAVGNLFNSAEVSVADFYHPDHKDDYFHFLVQVDRDARTSHVALYTAGHSKCLGSRLKREESNKWVKSESDDWTGFTDMLKFTKGAINLGGKLVSKINGNDEKANIEEKYTYNLIQCIEESVGL